MHTNSTVALEPNLMSSLLLCELCSISFNIQILQSRYIILNLYNKDPDRFAFHIFFFLNAVLVNIYHGKAIRDDFSAKTVLI